MRYLIPLAIATLLLTHACHKDHPWPPTSDCDKTTIVDATLYDSAPDDFLFLDTIRIQDNCLEITYSSSGCDGSTWITMLIDSKAILESFPVQRVLRLSLENKELCDAVFSKTESFDLTPIQLEEYDRILLNIDGYEEGPILYSY